MLTNSPEDLDSLIRIEKVLNGILSGSKNVPMTEVAVLLANVQHKIVAALPVENLPVHLQWSIAAGEIKQDTTGHLHDIRATPQRQRQRLIA
jgi:hypothetical protein